MSINLTAYGMNPKVENIIYSSSVDEENKVPLTVIKRFIVEFAVCEIHSSKSNFDENMKAVMMPINELGFKVIYKRPLFVTSYVNGGGIKTILSQFPKRHKSFKKDAYNLMAIFDIIIIRNIKDDNLESEFRTIMDKYGFSTCVNVN